MLEKYKEATSGSRKLWDRALKIFPGGINHNIRTFGLDRCGAYPPFMKRAEGSHIWDVDDNDYVDWWMTHYSMILGHNHPKIREYIQTQVIEGHHLGALNEPQVILGEKIREAIPFMTKMRFCTTGSESTAYAVRLARLFTGKRLVAKACGGWHGGNDALGYHLSYPFSDEPFFDGISFDFNNRESVDTLFNNHGKDLAAVVIEPVLGAGGGLAPKPDFLPYLREETEKRDILLIFDEIVTGFRLCYGSGGKEVFGVEPDLITLGKIAAGGMPVGVYGGREDVMSLATPGAKGGRWVGGGTFSSHPISMVAGIATLDTLQSLKEEYIILNSRGDKFRGEINELIENSKVDALATGTGSIIFIHWLKSKLKETEITGVKIGEALDKGQLDHFQGRLLEQGVFGYHGLGALSFAHSEKDLEFTLEAIEKVVTDLKS
ncbi:MAG: aspartate aminotransferase family protein [Candidatus Hodarchaeota archaeon]